jgi:hypothetical protein
MLIIVDDAYRVWQGPSGRRQLGRLRLAYVGFDERPHLRRRIEDR